MIELTELSRVLSLISWWVDTIKSHNAVNFFDINKVAEGVALKLLNEIYDYQLVNLNYETSNYPGIDLGDNINKIGFQITSRKDSRKIKESLKKFSKGPNRIYSNGIRFLILNRQSKPHSKKGKYQDYYSNFVPSEHILNADDLIKNIRRIYDSDIDKFYRIKEILEVEIAGKAMKKADIKLIRFKLFEGSKKYHEALTSSNGRFRHLNISDLILSRPINEWIMQNVLIEGEDETPRNILEALPLLWKREYKHSFILGDGGMGKTVSIVRLWKDYLDKQQTDSPIPIFIALNEYNQIAVASNREKFIVNQIRKKYDESITSEDIWEVMKSPIQNKGKFVPSLILLLDGYNEITLDTRELLNELGDLAERALGIQIVIAGRYDMRRKSRLSHFNLLELLELSDRQVDSYLRKHFKRASLHEFQKDQIRLSQLLKNPMMLTLYTATCEVQENHRHDSYIDFKGSAETPGEIMWNFGEAQVARLGERLGNAVGKEWFYRFLLKFLLPAIGYEMEKAGRFELSREVLDNFINTYCIRFSKNDFFDEFYDYGGYEDDLMLGELETEKEKRYRVKTVREILTEKLFLLVHEQNSYSFLHQHFRDFSAALHIRNELLIGLKRKELPGELKKNYCSPDVLRYLAEIEGEHYNTPKLIEGKGWIREVSNNSLFMKALNLCRSQFANSVGCAVWNIIQAWKEINGELSGIDLSNLDLSQITLNRIRCSRYYNGNYLSANFSGSQICDWNFNPQGHEMGVNSAIYTMDGEKIISASSDKTIKIWNVRTGDCIKTLTGHSSSVNSVELAPNSRHIISASDDNTIKLWDIASGQCLRTYYGHQDKVQSAIFDMGGQMLLSGSDDKTLKLWKVETGKCLRTYSGHSEIIKSVIFSPDGKKVLSTSIDNEIREWETESGVCLNRLDSLKFILGLNSAIYSENSERILAAGEEGGIVELCLKSGQMVRRIPGPSNIVSVSYSPNRKKILFGSWNNNVYEYDATTGRCLKKFKGHTDWISHTVYSPGGDKILSASFDFSIKVWNVKTGENIQTYHGFSQQIWQTLFSTDGKKILSSQNGVLNEWDVESGRCNQVLEGHFTRVANLEYSPDGKKILSHFHLNSIKEWNQLSGELIRKYDIPEFLPTYAIYRPDGKAVLANYTDHTIREWSGDDGMLLKEYLYPTHFEERAWTTDYMKYSPDGKRFTVVYSKSIIKQWDTHTGELLHHFKLSDEQQLDVRGILDLEYIQSKIAIFCSRNFYLIDLARKECSVSPYANNGWWAKLSQCSPGKKFFVNSEDGKILIRDLKTTEITKTIKNFPGLFIQNCSFKNLHPDSDLSLEMKEALFQYGAVFDCR
jgi:WD40 repeat protein